MYDQNGKLTREAMEEVIKGGGSVLLHRDEQVDERGNIKFHPTGPIERLADLPSYAELSLGDEQKMAKARALIQEAKAKLEAELALLDQKAPGIGDVFDPETANYASLVEKAKELGLSTGNVPKAALIEQIKGALIPS